MANPVLTADLLRRYREVVAASDAEAELPPHERSTRLGDALANVYGIVGSASIIVHLADEIARLTRERDEARRMLGECYILSGADPDGNAPDSPHLWAHAAEEVRRLREHYDELLIEGAQAEEAECAERARCVAHLRALADSVGNEEAIQVLLEAADAIEAGKHIPKRTPPTEPTVIYDWTHQPEPEGWGDFINLAPLSGDLSALSDEDVALRLAVLLSQISEELWCASWHTDLGAWSLGWANAADLPAGLDPDIADVLRRVRARLDGRWLDCDPGVGVVLREVPHE